MIASHVIRSAFENSDHQALQSDIANLRVEVHRARDLISGYNEVLEACESSTYWLKWANSCLFWVVVTLCCGIVWTIVWIYYGRENIALKAGRFVPVTGPVETTEIQPSPVLVNRTEHVIHLAKVGLCRNGSVTEHC